MAILDAASFSSSAASWKFSTLRALREGDNTILIDLDGTLACPAHRQHFLLTEPPDWVKFSITAGDDPPNLAQIEWLRFEHRYSSVVILSGRPWYALPVTLSWIEAHGIPWNAIALRPSGDTVTGIEHKLRVLSALRGAGILPMLAVDDSEPVGAAYRTAGIPCILPIRACHRD